ncbi:UNVERIFIED_CONTAM: hypothetical protein PYX00_001023 [Menopon gallinae]|uniref:Uncharacterized protein n=1 Tax=Menopon gallinae TaxID=328185 RepID=A0AAW2ICG6_9NEOP
MAKRSPSTVPIVRATSEEGCGGGTSTLTRTHIQHCPELICQDPIMVSHIDGSFDTELDSYVFSTRTTLESIAPITSQDSFTQPVKTPDTFQSTISRQREKSQESFYSGSSKPMESFQQRASTLSRQPKTFEVPRVPDTYSKTLNRSKSKESHYEPFMFRAQQQQQQQQQAAASVESAYQAASAKTPTFDKNDLVTDLPDSGYMITEL